MFRFDHPDPCEYAKTDILRSLWPLLKRDGLGLQYAVLFLTYAWLMGTFKNLPNHWTGKAIHLGSYAAVCAIHGAEYFIGTVARYPDLWVVANVLICFPAYVIAWSWTLWKLWQEAKVEKPKLE